MKTVETLTIPRTVLTKLVKRNRQLIYMNYFLVHLCAMRNIDLVFMADEVCRMLKITMRPTSFFWQSCSDGKRSLRKTGNAVYRMIPYGRQHENIQGARMRSLYA